MRSNRSGLSIGEMLIAVTLSCVLVAAGAVAMGERRAERRETEIAETMLGFSRYYMEMLRAQPFETIGEREPVSFLYPDVLPPASGKWIELNHQAYREFYPDLAAVASRDPWLKIEVLQGRDNLDKVRSKHISLEARWRDPASAAQRPATGTPNLSLRLSATVFKRAD